jgi:hypothetical protein
MLGEELCDIVGSAVDNDPARVAAVVLGYVGALEFDRLGVVAFVVHCGGDRFKTGWGAGLGKSWGKGVCYVPRREAPAADVPGW